jgi:hypothetical protein
MYEPFMISKTKMFQSSVFIFIHYLIMFKDLGSYYNIFLRITLQTRFSKNALMC